MAVDYVEWSDGMPQTNLEC